MELQRRRARSAGASTITESTWGTINNRVEIGTELRQCFIRIQYFGNSSTNIFMSHTRRSLHSTTVLGNVCTKHGPFWHQRDLRQT